MKPVHLVILGVAAVLIYIVFFAKKSDQGGHTQTKEEMIARVKSEACQLEKELVAKYGANPPPSAKTDPITIALMALFKKLQDLGVKTQPVCPGEA